jgi:hypothetical protein
MQAINVAIDDYIGPFPATTDGTTWNGWECPHFTFDVACDVAYAVIARGSIAGYDAERDAFFTLDHSTGVDVDTWQAANDAGSDGAFEDPDPAAEVQLEISPGVYLDFWPAHNGTYAIGAWSWVWDDITDSLARTFANDVRDTLTDEQWDEMRRRNATPGYAKACASHDFVDANECMDAAFFNLFGRHADASSASDIAAWNAAWDIARWRDLTDAGLRS